MSDQVLTDLFRDLSSPDRAHAHNEFDSFPVFYAGSTMRNDVTIIDARY